MNIFRASTGDDFYESKIPEVATVSDRSREKQKDHQFHRLASIMM